MRRIRYTKYASAVLSCLAFFFVGSPVVAEPSLRTLGADPNISVAKWGANGEAIVGHNTDAVMVPASTIKILTALYALDTLGPGYQFQTLVYRNEAGEILLRGQGDPTMVSEEVRKLGEWIRSQGLQKLGRVYLDKSFFDAGYVRAPGVSRSLNPYDALNSALAINFNTSNLRRQLDGTVVSAEQETPTIERMQKFAHLLNPGTSERINITTELTYTDCYATDLIAELIGAAQSQSDQSVCTSTVSDKDKKWRFLGAYHNRKTLQETSQAMLEYSNNFIANQIFLALGAHKQGGSASFDKSRTALRQYMRERLGIDQDVTVIEGAGISRENKMSAKSMKKILDRFQPYYKILNTKGEAYQKSGTLLGVYNYAGYFPSDQGLLPFVIFTNEQSRNQRDSILRWLEQQ